jgi:Flp pilus assembly protein TadB
MQDTPSTTAYPSHSSPGEFAESQTTPWRRSWWSTVTWEWVLLLLVVVAALAIVAVVTVLLFLGLLELIAIVSPVIVAVLLVWTAGLSVHTARLTRQVRKLEQTR